MRWELLRLLTITGGVAAILLIAAAYQHYRLKLCGDVTAADGRLMQGCKVELLIRWHILANWTGYVSREVVTNSGGAFSFSVLAPSGGTYRLRVEHPGYQEWLLEAATSEMPSRAHITLEKRRW